VEPGWNLCAYEKLRTVHLYLAIRSSALIEPSQYEPGTQMDLPKTEAGTLISGSNRLVRACYTLKRFIRRPRTSTTLHAY
jgi:hypothetical protein